MATKNEEGVHGIVHLMPPCTKFKRLDANEYVEACGRELSKGMPS